MNLLKTDPDAKGEHELMRDVALGDARALGELYSRYSNAVRSMLGYVVSGMTSHDVDDVTQEVFLSLGKAARSYTHRAQFKAFLFRIVVNRARDWQRKTWLRARIFKSDNLKVDLEKVSSRTLDPADSAVLRQTVRQAVATLSRKQREVIVLHVIEGFKCSEVASILGISPKTVRTRLHRARQTILVDDQIEMWLSAMDVSLQ